MTPSQRRDVALTYGLPAAFALGLITLQLARFGGLYPAMDDSYIYLGYVKRALQPPRALFSYNPGEHSAGTTGILYYYALIATAVPVRLLTFFLPIATSLTLAMYILNTALFIGLSALLIRLVRAQTDERPVWVFIAFALLVWNVKFTWGVFGGLENPLAAFLLLALAAAVARGVWVGALALLSGLLGATRPELVPTMALASFVAAVGARLPVQPTMAWMAGTLSRGVIASACTVLVLLAIILPCWLSTGRIFPSALDTRVSVDVLSDPSRLWPALTGFSPAVLLRSSWSIGSTALLIGLIAVSPYRNVRAPLAAMAFVVLQFLVRANFGLNNLSQQDRYVSYVWPLYVLAIMPLLHGLVTAGHASARTWAAPTVSALLAIYIAIGPLRELDERFSADVLEVKDVVVTPSQWMHDHLPANSRVSMEPAGAIRLYTDFYLLDVVGLTTDHRFQGGSFAEYLTNNRVDYVFNYPILVQELRDSSRYERLMSWTPTQKRQSLGEIGVYRLKAAPPPAAPPLF